MMKASVDLLAYEALGDHPKGSSAVLVVWRWIKIADSRMPAAFLAFKAKARTDGVLRHLNRGQSSFLYPRGCPE
jgi:hypothetical protein